MLRCGSGSVRMTSTGTRDVRIRGGGGVFRRIVSKVGAGIKSLCQVLKEV
jgi:hypothetical protein